MEDLKILVVSIVSSEKPINVFSLSEAADLAGVGTDMLKKGINAGTLKYVKNGSRTYVTAKALENFFQCCEEYV